MLPRIQFANYVEKQKYILYAPTYRPYRELVDTLRKINFNPKSVHQTIKEQHVKLKLRPHPLDNSPHLKDFLSLESYISIELDDTEDLYSMIRGYSAIITDFSSIYQDAKWLDIPVFTVCDDFDIYDEQSGLFDWYKKEVSEDMYSDFQEVIHKAVAIIND